MRVTTRTLFCHEHFFVQHEMQLKMDKMFNVLYMYVSSSCPASPHHPVVDYFSMKAHHQMFYCLLLSFLTIWIEKQALPVFLGWGKKKNPLYVGMLVSGATAYNSPLCFSGPGCPARCREQTTAPARVAGAQTSSRERRLLRSRSASRPSPRRKRPRSLAKRQPNCPPAPRGEFNFSTIYFLL